MTPSANTALPTSETLQSHVENGIPFYKFQRLSEFVELEHRIFTRLGGVSSPPFASLNVSYDTGDEAEKVRENLRRIRAAAYCSSLIYARQNHSSNIVVLLRYPRFDPAVPYPLHGKDGRLSDDGKPGPVRDPISERRDRVPGRGCGQGLDHPVGHAAPVCLTLAHPPARHDRGGF